MELQNKIENQYTYSPNELSERFKQFMKDAKSFIEKNNYHISGGSKESWIELDGVMWESYFINTSKNQRKKINKYLRRFDKNPTIAGINRFFHYIHTRVLSTKKIYPADPDWNYGGGVSFEKPDWIQKFSVEKPLKEQAIQTKKNEWIEARNKALEALNAYKEEKGNYFK